MPVFVVLTAEEQMGRVVTDDALSLLEAAGEVRVLRLGELDDASAAAGELARAAPDADAIVCAPWGAYGLGSIPGWLDICRSLRVVAGAFDNRIETFARVSFADLAARGITVLDTSRTMTPSVAEYVLAMILNLLRDLPDRIELMRSGGWTTAWCNAVRHAIISPCHRVGTHGGRWCCCTWAPSS